MQISTGLDSATTFDICKSLRAICNTMQARPPLLQGTGLLARTACTHPGISCALSSCGCLARLAKLSALGVVVVGWGVGA
jgi:hypothetical protein